MLDVMYHLVQTCVEVVKGQYQVREDACGSVKLTSPCSAAQRHRPLWLRGYVSLVDVLVSEIISLSVRLPHFLGVHAFAVGIWCSMSSFALVYSKRWFKKFVLSCLNQDDLHLTHLTT